MKKWLKRFGIFIMVLVGLLVVVIASVLGIGVYRFNRSHIVQVDQIEIPTDPISISRGEHLVKNVAHCGYCHGPNLAGDYVVNNPGAEGVIVAPNLTSGEGGLGATYITQDWVRTIHHGITPGKRSVLIMPSLFFDQLSQEDLAATIAYLQTIPPVDNVLPKTKPGPLVYALIGLGPFTEAMSALQIDHEASYASTPEENAAPEYGAYLVEIAQCRACHGSQLAGGQACSSCPIGPNLTPGGSLSRWTEEDFINALRTGQEPSGRQIANYMPWEFFRGMTDTELRAIWAYLNAQPALENQLP